MSGLPFNTHDLHPPQQNTGMGVTFNTHDRHEYEVKEEGGHEYAVKEVGGGFILLLIVGIV
jgi:hypothetical protein